MISEPTLYTETNLKDYWQVLVRRRWVVLSFFIICSVTVTLGTFLMTPIYRASTKIIIEGESTSVRSTDENSSVGSSYDIYENYLETQIVLIKSDGIAGKVYEEFNLGETPRYKKRVGLAKLLRKNFSLDINLERIKGTRMIEISMNHPDPQMAADLANRLAELYSNDNLNRRALTFIRNQKMASLNAEFLRLQDKLDTLSMQFGPKHPEMLDLKKEIRLMAKRMENERSNSGDTPANADLSLDQQALEEALLKIQESSVLSSSKMNNTGIIDRAYAPTEVHRPKRALNIILGLVMGLVGGVLLAFFVDYLDDTIKTDDDLKRHIGNIIFLGALLSEHKPASQKAEIDRLLELNPESASAEAYRLIRTRILWSVAKENVLKDFAVLSAGAAEGKSTVASNLAISLSQVNKKVLLVDTDLRRGRLHQVYDVLVENGLGEYLTGDLSLKEVVKPTGIPNLSLVTAGRSVIDFSQLFSSAQMTEFIRQTREKFDFIVYDTPPVMIISDTLILIPQLNGYVLTVRSGITKTRHLAKALSMIRETSNMQLFGIILNGTSLRDKHIYKNYYHKI